MAEIAVTSLSSILPEDLTTSNSIITFTADGNTNQVALFEAVNAANNNNGCVCIKSASLTIASADVLQLNSVPITIVAAQGVGTAIEVISASVKIDFNTVAYATNVGLALYSNGADEPQLLSLTALNATVNSIRRLAVDSTYIGADTQIIENAAIVVGAILGNPTAGDSDITVYVLYRVIKL
jgi:hypothetical protein